MTKVDTLNTLFPQRSENDEMRPWSAKVGLTSKTLVSEAVSRAFSPLFIPILLYTLSATVPCGRENGHHVLGALDV